ncbi:MAG: hypothetical protein NZ518_01715, partial [Dehalococcoidia bacterium]|nr:hypothetical protein [Dehalococcoidia bacterium]
IALEDGRTYGLGTNVFNGFGMPTPAPGRVGSAAGPQLLPAAWGSLRGFGFSFYYSLFGVRSDGSVASSGYNQSDELGLGDQPDGTIINGPQQVVAETCSVTPCTSFITGVEQVVSTDSLATLALRGGQVLGWGSTSNSLLGTVPGNPPSVAYPRLVPASVPFTSLSSAHVHALAIGPGDAVYSWGSGLRGALGDGVDGSTRSTPQLVTLP